MKNKSEPCPRCNLKYTHQLGCPNSSLPTYDKTKAPTETLRTLLNQRQQINMKLERMLSTFNLEVDALGMVRIPMFENHAPKDLQDKADDFFSGFNFVDKLIWSTKQLDYPVSEHDCNELCLFLELDPIETAKLINQCSATQEQMNDYHSFYENEMRDYL